MMLDDLYWREPRWLLLALWPGVLFLLTWLRQRRQWDRIADPHLRPWLRVRDPAIDRADRWRRLILVMAWLLLCTALAGPRTPHWLAADAEPEPTHVMAVVDRSRSMDARDGHPDRIGDAKRLLLALSRQSQTVNWGLVIYAGQAHRLAAPTFDQGFIRARFEQLDQLNTPTLGNALAPALQAAAQALRRETSGAKAVLLLSDGDIEPPERERAMAVAASWAKQFPETRLRVVGAGGPGAIPIPDGEQGWLTHTGSAVLTRRDEAWLRALATRAGGRYERLEAVSDLADLHIPVKSRISSAHQADVVWFEWFSWPLIGALLLLLPALLRTQGVKPYAPLVALLFLASPHKPVDAADLSDAYASLLAGDAQAAREAYRAAKGYRARFGEGVACYRLEDWGCAAEAWSAAVLAAENDDERVRAIFNLGDLRFRLGQFDEAQVLFEDALGYLERGASGVERSRLKTNLAFASALSQALERSFDDQQQTLRRAAFRSRALGERAGTTGLPGSSDSGLIFARQLLDTPGIRSLLAGKGLDANALDMVSARSGASGSEDSGGNDSQQFVRLEPLRKGNDAAIWKRLLEMESGYVAPLSEARALKGQRPW